jgi:hypothetical protein
MSLNYKITTYILLSIVISLVVTIGVLAATGTTDSSAPPGATNAYTLMDIYNRINDGTVGTKSTFTEPGVAPGTGTMKTLNDIYDLASERSRPPKTGDTYTNSNVTGEDGELKKGVDWPSPRFTDNTDGTVTDNLTGLIWLENANCPSASRTWSNALSDVTQLNTDGTMNANDCGDTSNGGSHQTDWRLPNVRELQSLIDYGQSFMALPSTTPFSGVQAYYYWSSTTFEDHPDYAWLVSLDFGRVDDRVKTDIYYVWPVRGGQ